MPEAPKKTKGSTDKSTDKRLANLKEPWKPGQSGNPEGKKIGQRTYAALYREALIKIGRSQGKTPEEIEEIMHQSGLTKALKGDYAFYRDVLDRLYGKPVQKNEHGGMDGNPIEVRITKL